MEHATSTAESTAQPTDAESVATDTRTVRRLFGVAMLAAIVGWLDTAFLTGIHYAVFPLPEGAPIAGTGWEVLTSEWSYILGIPTALYGAMYYLVVLALGVLWFTERVPQVERVLLPVTAVGIASSVVFVYLQLFVIEAICPFCMVSAVTTTILFLIGIAVYRASEAPSLGDLGTTGLDAGTLVWPVALVLVPATMLAMIHLASVAPLPIPGS